MSGNNEKLTELNKDKMLERGTIVLNGYEFMVYPIYLGEETKYFNSICLYPVPMRSTEKGEDTPFTDKEISNHIRALFKNENYARVEKTPKIQKNKLIMWFVRKFKIKKHYYDDMYAKTLIKWLENKVEYKSKSVTLYDLERKFKLSKAEIGKLLILIHELSGF